MKEINNKINRFNYLSDYYKSLLVAKVEFNQNKCATISINNKTFQLWKVKGADEAIRDDLNIILDDMIFETEKELKDFFD